MASKKTVNSKKKGASKRKAPQKKTTETNILKSPLFIHGLIWVVIFVFTFLFRLITVSGTSMQPNFMDGDRVMVSMIGNSYKTGDVIVAVNVLDDPIIKRVIATEGQTVRIDYEAGVVYVDDQPVDETRFGLENGITRAVYTSLEKTELPATVPEGCVFVLGDNRRVSEDSRYAEVGMIDVRNVLGKAVLFVSPVSKFGWIGG